MKLIAVGQVFGRLTVMSCLGGQPKHGVIWKCRCSCGTRRDVAASRLRSGSVRSCGCLLRESILKHGDYGSPTYVVWASMIKRCHSKTSTGYQLYGGRGIQVCARWRKSYEAFLADMGPRPDKGMSIDRVNSDRNYEPDNCRWASKKTQSNNRRNTILVTIDGVTKPLTVWVELRKLNYASTLSRIQRGWTPLAAVTIPTSKRRKKHV